MASKRSSRVFVDEAAHSQEGHQIPTSSSSSNTPLRSRQGSQSSPSFEGLQQETISADELVASHKLEAISMARSSSTSTVSMDSTVSSQFKDSTEEVHMHLSGRIITEFTNSMRPSAIVSQPHDYPIAPLTGRPHNFGIVIPGIYRSSYPKLEDFDYIKGLGLKTIVTLVKKDDLDHDLESFVTRQGINQIVFNMKGTKKQAIPLKTMQSILSVVLDKENYPLLIHCNHGKHRTGCVVGLIRKLSGWRPERAVAEYRSFAEPKIREVDVDYLSSFQISTLHASIKDMPSPVPAKSTAKSSTFFRAFVFSAIVLFLWILSGTKMNALTRCDGL